MDNIQQLADEIYRDRVRRARAMSPEEKFLAGPRLFRYACRITLEGIRNQYPDADEERVHEILRKRLDWRRRREEQELERRKRTS